MKLYWTEEVIADRLREEREKLGRIPRANDMPAAMVKSAQRRFGSWNRAVKFAFGEVTQARYGELSDEDLLNVIRGFVEKHQRLPLRSEFDGKKYPYFEAYVTRFGKRRWADILALVDLSKARYYANNHGYGRVYSHNGVNYLSREEYLIGKYLSEQGIEFEKEVPYENSNHLFDFFLPAMNVYIEYYGVATPEYKARIEEKRKLYDGRTVIEVFKHENTIGALSSKLQRL